MIDCLLTDEASVLLLLSATVRAACRGLGGNGFSPALGEASPVIRSVLKASTSIVFRFVLLSG